ncbi:MAG: copper homeostasis protein CutC, partial [Ginsengibacter sp.]
GLEDVIELGFERILTSGLQPKAIEGAELLRELILKARDRIIIMPGSGVTSNNIISLTKSTGAAELHSSGSKYVESKMGYLNESMNEKLTHILTNEEEVFKMSELIKRLKRSPNA